MLVVNHCKPSVALRAPRESATDNLGQVEADGVVRDRRMHDRAASISGGISQKQKNPGQGHRGFGEQEKRFNPRSVVIIWFHSTASDCFGSVSDHAFVVELLVSLTGGLLASVEPIRGKLVLAHDL